MKIIKKGKPYRQHKCSECKTIYVYKFSFTGLPKLIYCPQCNNWDDCHWFDKKISQKQYDKMVNVGSDNNDC